jgi:hypothetical protein
MSHHADCEDMEIEQLFSESMGWISPCGQDFKLMA